MGKSKISSGIFYRDFSTMYSCDFNNPRNKRLLPQRPLDFFLQYLSGFLLMGVVQSSWRNLCMSSSWDFFIQNIFSEISYGNPPGTPNWVFLRTLSDVFFWEILLNDFPNSFHQEFFLWTFICVFLEILCNDLRYFLGWMRGFFVEFPLRRIKGRNLTTGINSKSTLQKSKKESGCSSTRNFERIPGNKHWRHFTWKFWRNARLSSGSTSRKSTGRNPSKTTVRNYEINSTCNLRRNFAGDFGKIFKCYSGRKPRTHYCVKFRDKFRVILLEKIPRKFLEKITSSIHDVRLQPNWLRDDDDSWNAKSAK